MRLGAVVITYNSQGHVGACLRSLRTEDFPGGIVVVDNASSDSTLEEVRALPYVQVIANARNEGFAAAANQGFTALASAEAILLLNPDVRLASAPDILAASFADPSVAAAGGMLLGDDGSPQTGFQFRRFPTPAALAFETLGLNRLFPSNPVNRNYRALDLSVHEPAEGIQPAGACVLIRASAWRAAGGFDERFHPLWFEDVDLLRRFSCGGWRILYLPDFCAFHEGAHSIGSLTWSARHLYWYNNLVRYGSLHFGLAGRLLVCGAVVLGVLPRVVLGMCLERSVQPASVYGRLVRSSLAYLLVGRQNALPVRSESEDFAHRV
ncbi:MAG: glycosyltransferase family 2 protein [Acidobacteria bacterium]|nr:glycosyltransferase family 2 protein [Acidobacteriota bacterium]